VNFPPPVGGRDRRIAYVEFGDEEAMKAGLDKHAEVCPVPSLSSRRNTDLATLQKLGDGIPEVKRSDNEQRGFGGHGRDGRGGRAGFRGRSGFRGGFGGRGFANRGLSAAGLVGGGDPPKANGDA
jgi:hypothetical protein